MARHLLRDYITIANNTSSTTFIGSYLATIFMRRVLGYSYVGDTNYNINSVGTLLISTADSTPTATIPTFAGGTRAGINLGLNTEFNVSIPAGTRVVSATDKGRIIVLKSNTNPQYNSGCFFITDFDTGTNSYKVDFRSGTTITPDTTITATSNGLALPQATINVVSTAAFPASGTISVFTDNAVQTVTYTAKTASTFTGCTGGTGIIRTGNGVANNATTLPQSTLTVASTTGFPSSGTLFVFTSTGKQTVTYTGITATTFTGCSLTGTGIIGFAPVITTINTTIAAASNGQSLPQATVNVASTTTATTSITASSNNVPLPAATINVATTSGFATSGSIYVNTNLGFQLVTYTGTTATTFTGCTGGSGFMATSNQVLAGYSPTGGVVYVTTSTGVQQVNYTSTSGGNSFTGCTGGTGTMSTGGVVYYSPSVPRIEATDSMNWYLYERDVTASAALVQGTSNGNTNVQYRGYGTSTTPRIILQSPHPLGWQVRVCHETTNDSGCGTAPISAECALITFAPGFGGDAFGDFAVSGPHLHAPLFFNSNSLNLQGGAVGFGDNLNIPSGTSSMTYRITMVGDTDGYGCTIFGRRPGNSTVPRSFMLSYGMCELEATPLPPNNEARLYALGSGNSQSSGQNLNDVSWYPGNIASSSNTQGVTMKSASGSFAVPVSANTSLISYATGSSAQGGPIFDGSAGDTPWFGGVELFSVDIIAGVINTWNNSSPANYGFPYFDLRFLGTIPHIREGRANYAEYSITADQVAQHMRRGVWLLWGGPPVVT